MDTDFTLRLSALEAAFAQTCGLTSAEDHYSSRVLEAADRFKGLAIGELLMMQAYPSGHYWGSLRITSGNLGEVMQAAFSTGTLSDILSRAGDKLLLEGFLRAPQSWREVATVGEVNNLRPQRRFTLTSSLQYQQVPASGQLSHANLQQENYDTQADTHGLTFTISREDIVNDDVGVFKALQTTLGFGAGLALAKAFWSVWLAAVDGAAFWTAGRKNYQTGGTTALGDASLSDAIALFRAMKTSDGVLLGLEPTTLLVPPQLEAVARKFFVATQLSGAGDGADANIHRNRFRPVVVPELSDSDFTGYSTTHWFLCADARVLASAEVSFLNGKEAPTVETTTADLKVLGIKGRGYHDFGVAMSEYRASVHSTGA